MMAINASKAFEYGLGFRSSLMKGSENNDRFILGSGSSLKDVKTETNNSGGIQGGISNGMPIYFSVGFKPTPTIRTNQKTLDTSLNEVDLPIKGRHDACIGIRAGPVVEAMAALVLADAYIQQYGRMPR